MNDPLLEPVRKDAFYELRLYARARVLKAKFTRRNYFILLAEELIKFAKEETYDILDEQGALMREVSGRNAKPSRTKTS